MSFLLIVSHLLLQQVSSPLKCFIDFFSANHNKTIIIKDGDKTLIDQYSKEEDSATQNHTKTLIKENSTYLILPDRKEY